MYNTNLKRRDFLRLGSAGILSATIGAVAACQSNPTTPLETLSTGSAQTATAPTTVAALTSDDSVLEVALTAIEDTVAIVGEQMTQVWRYVGEVTQGDPAALVHGLASYLGPTFRVQQGQRVRITFKNEFPVPSGIHWHGLLVPERMDGHPRDHVAPGKTFIYDFVAQNRAGTYWYHPHPDRTTGGQVYRGLAGLFIVTDGEEAALPLPRGDQDIALVLQDRAFDDSGQLLYGGNDPVRGAADDGFYGNGHTQSMGMAGNQILVNGQPDYTVTTAATAHRVRVLNGSNSRTYVLAWSDQSPLTVIGTDGGLLEAPVERPYVILGPAERVELWADFRRAEAAGEIALISYAMGGGNPFLLTRFSFNQTMPETLALPAQLTQFAPLTLADAVNAEQPRTFLLGASQAGWSINGRTFELEAVADDERVQLNTAEVWEFINDGSAGGMLMGHPMHIHGVQFRIIERSMTDADPQAWASIQAGYVDEGWKDTVTLMAGERVKVLMRFEAHPGLFLTHCHVLEHEGMRMMRNFLIEEQG